MSTQFEGLKVLTRETILKAYKHLDEVERKASDAENLIVPALSLQNVNDVAIEAKQMHKKQEDDD